jgi:hypothetical protein
MLEQSYCMSNRVLNFIAIARKEIDSNEVDPVFGYSISCRQILRVRRVALMGKAIL